MKHSLLIHLKLLLSSLLTSLQKKEETLYRWENPSGDGSVWKRFGDKQTQPRYEGEIKREYILFGDYILEGLGSLTSTDGEKYVGEWKDGKLNGQGTYTWSDGDKYVGEYKDGKPWNGTDYDKNGNILGKWVNGEIE